MILGSLRIKPETPHFGWNWNLVQPLLYRHHHRIRHDLRIQEYLLDLLTLQQEAANDETAPAGYGRGPGELPLAFARFYTLNRRFTSP